MEKDEQVETYRLPNFSKIRAAAVLAIACAQALTPTATHADDAKKTGTFSSDTIEDDGVRFSLNYALPVELVEEGVQSAEQRLLFERTPTVTKPEESLSDDELEAMTRRGASPRGPKPTTSQLGAAVAPADGAGGEAETTTLLNVKDADITALIKTFSKLTGRNYIVDSNVKGTVTIHLPTPVTIEESLRLFDSVLLMKGFTTVPVGENTWKVVPAKTAKQTTIPLIRDGEGPPSDKLVTQFVRLKYVSAADLQKLLSQYTSSDGVINSFSGSNSLIIVDSEANIARLKDMIEELDVPAINQELTIIPVLHADVTDIAEKIQEILGAEDKEEDTAAAVLQSARARIAARARARAAAQAGAAGSDGENIDATRTLPMKVIPDERTNSIILLADPELTARVQALVERLDSPVDLAGGRFYVYRLKHADAEELSDVLQEIISGASESSSEQGSARTGSSLTRRSQQTNTPARESAASRIAEVLRARRLGSQPQEEGGKVNFEGDVSIAPDASTNSLIINASKGDYLRIKSLLDELDVKRPQVIVEATILEVSLNKEEGMGFELQTSGGGEDGGIVAQTNYGGLTELVTNPAALTDLTIAAASSGTLTLPGGLVVPSQAILVKALSRNSNVNVLSAPTILTTDNEEAEIIVGENVPFVTSTSTDTSNINNTFNSIERQDVGITLRITPQISSGNFVTLQIFVEISNVVQGTRNDPNGPTTTIRTTETNVEIKDGQMVVTGGLISDNLTESTRGIPFLQDIPFLGHLFKREDVVQRRTNLLIFITPKIIKDQYDARETTIARRDELRSTMDELGSSVAREEVLQSKDIDHVVEQVPAPEVAPSTIRPPKRVTLIPPQLMEKDIDAPAATDDEASALARTRERLHALMDESAPARPEAEEPVIDVTVTPALPGELPGHASSGQPTESTAAARPRMADTIAEATGVLSPAAYVVLRAVHPNQLSDSDLTTADENGTIGLLIPATQSDTSGNYFQVGRRYVLNRNGRSIAFVCLGAFSNQESAGIIHPGLRDQARWNRLSESQAASLPEAGWNNG
ncbi:MAG: type II secretion system secretin GspD [Bdellovibrionales bacterium]|nr:type II secretion system secretin GspD [Bdellovibrionales bacterium]